MKTARYAYADCDCCDLPAAAIVVRTPRGTLKTCPVCLREQRQQSYRYMFGWADEWLVLACLLRGEDIKHFVLPWNFPRDREAA